LRKQWNAEGKVVILGVASQWTETKGWKDWSRLAQRLDKNRYTVVMVGASRRQQQELPDHCVMISKTDNRTQLAQVYSAADIYVNLAHQEAFGLTLLEAMACGTPCISYDNTAIPETTTQETAIVLPDRDIDAVQRAIAQAGSEWKQQCSGECRNHVLNKFNNIDKIQEYLRLYGELTAMRS
jgi:glycosyltransferase involved in cell wall biosynthesis